MDNNLKSHCLVMEELKRRLELLLQDVPRKSRLVFVDYPVYFNIGDLLIDLGTQAFFRDFDHEVLGRFSIGDLGVFRDSAFTPERSISVLDQYVKSASVIVCQGGGNMGDIWPEHQLLREMLAIRYPNTKIVILPQSIEFKSQAQKKRAVDVFRGHGGVSLYVRDQVSMDDFNDPGFKIHMLPDMAHQLWTGNQVGQGRLEKILYVKRQDMERLTGDDASASGSMDWHDLVGIHDRLLLKIFQGLERTGLTLKPFSVGYALWSSVERRLARSAEEAFAEYGTIATDRLHAMILASLLSKRVVFSDNSYGKLGRYYSAWLSASPLITPEQGDVRQRSL